MLVRVRRGRIVGPLRSRRYAKAKPKVDPLQVSSAAREAAVLAAVLSALQALAAGVRSGALGTAMRDGDVEAAIDAALAGVGAFRLTMQGIANDLYGEAAGWGGSVMLELGLRFDLTDQRAIDWAASEVARLVVEVEDPTRQAIRDIVVRALRDGMHPYEAADLIEGVVGLHSRYANAVYNYWWSLTETQMDMDRIAVLVGAYYDRLLGLRAETIARTEILSAANAGRAIGWQQARDAGFLPGNAEKIWVAADDERTCPICGELDGEQVPMDDVFSSGDDMPPAHPSCRCTASIVTFLPEGGTTTAEVAE